MASSSDLYGPVGVVFAVLGWLLVFGRLVVYSAIVEVVLWEERHGTVHPHDRGAGPAGSGSDQRHPGRGAEVLAGTGRRPNAAELLA